MKNKCIFDVELLKPYGKVEKCEESNGQFHVKITDGFSVGMRSTMTLIGKINDVVGHKYGTVVRCVTDENLFEVILKPTIVK